MENQSQVYYTPFQLKLPVDLEKIIEINDPVYTFCEVMDHINLNKYLAVEESKWNRSYTGARRRGLNGLIFEISLICCGFNLHKFHLKRAAQKIAA